MLPPVKPVRYRLDQWLRNSVHYLTGLVTTREKEQPQPNLANEEIKKLLIVRATFRLGDSVIAIPAIFSFRKLFPNARIDFLGAPLVVELFKDLPLDNVFTITRSYPGSGLYYPMLLHQLRSTAYDVAADVSCSKSAMGAFLVGFSAARFRIGLRGKWDRWFNVRVNKASEINKYKILPRYLQSLGVECDFAAPLLVLSKPEQEAGRDKLHSLINGASCRTIVGVFVGGRKSWAKRWPVRNFCELITALRSRGLSVVVFIGPEERDLIGSLRATLDANIPIVFEPAVKKFAALISNCSLFVTCDSGPMHLAYALGVPTVAIFLHPNFERWAPPADLVKVVYEPAGCTPEEFVRICTEILAVRDHAA